MGRLRLVVAAVVFASLQSCYSVKHEAPLLMAPVVTLKSPKGFDQTWSAIIEWFASNQIGISTIEKVSGIVVAQRPVAMDVAKGKNPSEGVDFGMLNGRLVLDLLAKRDRFFPGSAQMKFNVFVKTVDDHQLVTVNTHWYARILPRDPNNPNAPLRPIEIEGVSDGSFEEAFLRVIAHRTGASIDSVTVIKPVIPEALRVAIQLRKKRVERYRLEEKRRKVYDTRRRVYN